MTWTREDFERDLAHCETTLAALLEGGFPEDHRLIQTQRRRISAITDHLARRSEKVDRIRPDGVHEYWSTHCRHGRHDACSATELAPGVPRQPAQCKTCEVPCICTCHQEAK